jgi:hypothetical protein
MEFLEGSQEEALNSGDKVTILTNDLEHYDLLPETLKIIGANLVEGVKYDYYLPFKSKDPLRHQVEKLCSSLLDQAKKQGIRNLTINKVEGPLIYNYSIVEKSGIKKSYWYQATKPVKGGAELLIIEIKGSESSDLDNFFSTLSSESVPIKDLIFPEGE